MIKTIQAISSQLSQFSQLKMLRPILIIIFVVTSVRSAQILGFFATPSRSVFIIQDALMQGLAAAGHNVTVVSLYPLENDTTEVSPNYRRVWIAMSAEHQQKIDQMQSKLLENADKKENFLVRMPRTISTMNAINVAAMNHPDMLRIRDEQHYDLLVLGWFFNDFQIGLASQFNCPAVLISTIPAGKLLRDYVANPNGHTSKFMASTGGQLTFATRMINTVAATAEFVATHLFNYFVNRPYYQEQFPESENYPSFERAKERVSLVLAAQHFSEQQPQANFPGLIEIAGIHIKKRPDALPERIQRFLDDANEGAIYFSLGSNVNSATLPAEKLAAILSVFRQCSQRIIWKWETDALPVGHVQPTNVMIAKWLPQDDILAHRNVRVFISHCGKGSVAEAKYHGVPILGMAIYGDQVVNLKAIVAEGWAVKVDYVPLDARTFGEGLAEILGNSTYRNVAQRVSSLYRDRPAHPLDTAIYWVEYVMRWNGALHMRSQAVHLNWLQLNSLDVLGFVGGVLVAIWWLLKIVFRLVLLKKLENKKNPSMKSTKKLK